MVYIVFIIAAVFVVYGAIQLNKYGDVISQKSAMSGAMVGTVLIAGATSLPELTTSVTAVYIDNVDIAVGNMLGSNVFNLLIIALIDFIYRRKRAFDHVNSSHQLPAALFGVVMTLIVIVALIWDYNVSIFNIGIEMFVLVALYIVCVKLFDQEEPALEADELIENEDISLKKAIRYFVFSAIAVLVAGSILSISGDLLAVQTGMNSSFVGSVLIAAATSLPELVAVIAAFKIANYAMAIGSILGSNLFNLLLIAFTDAFYQKGPILQGASPSMIATASLSLGMMVITLFMLIRKQTKNLITYALPPMIIIITYIVVSYQIFNY
ncbi:sodium:calcium antiporter [Alkalibacillus aidingensis]|uniref:sodium:calcium antiporter n=1 Tax=Alkalibacillus aidingensis TaxID=2747607 RepID=UPI0016604513|nr:sodium:calcium antiporter [Alkalibacillus aidingensis]